MVICPRCEQPVDEKVRNTCPLCFTPLDPQAAAPQAQPAPGLNAGMPGAPAPQAPRPAAPPLYPQAQPLGGAPLQTPPAAMPLNAPLGGAPAPPNAMPLSAPSAAPLRGPNTRVTLNGDIIDAPPSQAPVAPPMSGGPANRPAAPRPSYGVAPRREESKRSAGSTAAIVLTLLVVLGLGGFGGWYYMMHRTNPKDQAQKFFAAVKSQDWKAMYELTEQTDANKAKYKDADDFAQQTKAQLDKSGLGSFLGGFLSSMTFDAQDPKDNDGTTATVPVKLSMSILGQSGGQTQDIKMKNFNGIWKVSADNKGMTSFGNLSGGLGGGMGRGGFGSMGGGR